jgi:preprotein translocase subunit SecG
MLASALLLASFIGVLKGFIFVLFILVALLMTLVVLLQEPKGGGLSGAFGGVGAETFGVQTGGVNKFTSYLAALFLGMAILYAALREPEPEAPSDITTEEIVDPLGGPLGDDGAGTGGTGTPPDDDGKK